MDARANLSRHISLRRALDWLPHWAVALFLALPLAVAALSPWWHGVPGGTWQAYLVGWVFLAPVFLPGAVKRLNWRHGLVMLLMAGAVLAVSEVLEQTPVARLSWLPAPYLLMTEVGSALLLAGLGEMFLTRQWRRPAMVRLAAASLAGACVVAVVQDGLSWCAWQIHVPLGQGAHQTFTAVDLFALPLMAVVVWLAVPAVIRAGDPAAGWRRPALAAAIGAAIGGFAAFYGLLLYPLAEQSAHGNGPFPKHRAGLLLEMRGSSQDFARLAQILETADWTREPNLNALPDWRDVYVCILARHDSPAAAERLSALLAATPTPTLAWLSASLLAENKRYEAVPLLARYAMRGHNGSEACLEALEEMRIPQATHAILQEVADFQYGNRRLPAGQDFELAPNRQRRLTTLLGCDEGASYQAWDRACNERMKAAPTPLSPELQAETDRVVQSIARFREARDRLTDACRNLIQKLLAESGKQDEAAHKACTLKARKSLLVKGPNWNAPTTQEFAVEIDAFAARVEASIAKNRGGDAQTDK
jgi:hypothetical protein